MVDKPLKWGFFMLYQLFWKINLGYYTNIAYDLK